MMNEFLENEGLREHIDSMVELHHKGTEKSLKLCVLRDSVVIMYLIK